MHGAKLKQDVLINVFLTALRLFALMYVIRTAGLIFAPYALGYFLLARRISGTGANFLQLGSSKTLLRYLPMHMDDQHRKAEFVIFSSLMSISNANFTR